MKRIGLAAMLFGLLAPPVSAQVNFDAMIAQGKEFFESPASCWVCHQKTGEGLIGHEIGRAHV